MQFLFVIVLGFIAFTIVKGIVVWSNNNSQPQIPYPTVILTKKSEDTIQHNAVNNMTTTTIDTNYYIVFRLETGEQKKIYVSYKLYKSVDEGTKGILTLQGTRFISFEPSLD